MSAADTKSGRESVTGSRSGSRGRNPVRERIIDAAYDLFSMQGISQVGVDKVIAKSGCAKATLYNQFGSKDGLIEAYLDRREAVWTRGWLETEIHARSTDPEGRLMAIFDLFDEWFRRTDFEGCAFINALNETEHNSRLNRLAAEHLAKIRRILEGCAEAAGLADTGDFAAIWHMMMKGSITAAQEGNRSAARLAKRGAAQLLASWPRVATQ
ncbi:TetR/AcrR family transcriptional regulator [Notoacmeibacter sp. MSK16QG-6]|uniref:TetR/AcrR family transcriptional regulator n=1 Tax=Notoacmeibacter sp. MSK16QG-6 TaxID=2957982 RepID=UPI00209DEEBE|nr:TetR/AcrR family transcriptional regulator [Notoacmeibacter sp. MSK16QG-6]MCP1199503.1 TetR/AcrR family transcriptional regulator [Notoacmeibacter sp. MSK16QG-6]